MWGSPKIDPRNSELEKYPDWGWTSQYPLTLETQRRPKRKINMDMDGSYFVETQGPPIVYFGPPKALFFKAQHEIKQVQAALERENYEKEVLPVLQAKNAREGRRSNLFALASLLGAFALMGTCNLVVNSIGNHSGSSAYGEKEYRGVRGGDF